ncbi:MAG TPA: ABC transporter permease [Stellaceae bacterium]|jgi:peptide/nickel transport system permease protein|nr:ABC transporter permease [Stellaceae bacterium]
MTRYLAGRLLQIIVVLFVMSFIIYGLIGLMPGDPIDVMAATTPGMTAETVARLKAAYGLDQPLVTRYWHWLTAALQLDFGYSRVHSQPAIEVILPALLQTVKLAGLALFFSLALALVLGVASALKPGGWVDTLSSLFAFAGISIPTFWLAILLILGFAVGLGWLPASGMGDDFADQIRHMALPVATLTIATTGQFIRFVRAEMIEVLRMDYVRTARAKGVGKRRLVVRHALRNALIPVVTVVALQIGTLFSGALVTETMFALRGMGKMIYDSILGNDYNLALMGLLFATLLTLLGNLLADLAYAWLDPRIAYK